MSGELPIALRRALVHSPDSELRTRSPDLRPNERPIANSPNSCATFRTRAPTLSPTSRPSDRVRDLPIVFAIAELAFAIALYLCSHSSDPMPRASDNYGNVYASPLSFIVQYLVYSCALGKGDP